MGGKARKEEEVIEAEVIRYDPLADPHQSLASALLPCQACGTPRQIGSRFCVACGVPFETPNEGIASGNAVSPTPDLHGLTSTQPAVVPEFESDGSISTEATTVAIDSNSTTFRCQNCGSEVDVIAQNRSLRCPFCDSTYVMELTPEQRTQQRPEFIIGFEITREKAQELFFEWLGKNSFFRPGDLTRKALTEKQNGVYIPFWHFSMKAKSDWNAQIGVYWYRTETYQVKDSDGKTRTMTRVVRETEWSSLSGVFRKYYSGYMVSASKGLPQKESLAIQPYKLSSMVRYRPMYLAGWMSEEYSISKEDSVVLAEQEFQRRQAAAIERFMPGDTHSSLRIQTDLDVGDSDLILLPVHVLSYRYRDQVYRFLVNGQSGKVFGEKPWSKARITAVILGIAFLLLVIIALLIAFNHPRLDG
jgi:DNA-directed RNA polymerase subunit RPC12/RpoP